MYCKYRNANTAWSVCLSFLPVSEIMLQDTLMDSVWLHGKDRTPILSPVELWPRVPEALHILVESQSQPCRM